MKKVFSKPHMILIVLTLIGGLLHFYNVNWGAPFYFHPDERNIASAVAQMHFPTNMNPHFFAYGSLPIYVIYFTGYATNYILTLLTHQSTAFDPTFSQAILLSRIYSALFATLLIPLLFSLGKKLKNERTGLLTAFFATASTGFIQFAHFGTFEMWLTYFSTLLFWSCLTVVKEKKLAAMILASLIFGILVAVKISSLALLPLPLLVILIASFQNTRQPQQNGKIRLSGFLKFRHAELRGLLSFLRNTCLFIVIATATFIISNPYVILDQKDFVSSMQYETGVALGTERVFYTGNFVHTIPGIYQFLHVYPFLINPLMTVIFIVAFIYLIMQTIKTKNLSYLILSLFYVILFISQAFLYVKWTRYMVPTLPFMLLSVAIALNALTQTNKQLTKLLNLELVILLILNCLVAFSYFKVAFLDVDSRILAVLFAQQVIPPDAHILSEPADLGAMPFQEAFTHFDTFNFYDLDENPQNATETQLQQKIANAHYIILPSQRIIQSRLENPTKFPKGYVFYKTLLNGSLGFKKIYETPCDVFCTIVYLGDPVYWWEQTASVFDHPTVMIFRKETNQISP